MPASVHLRLVFILSTPLSIPQMLECKNPVIFFKYYNK